MNGTETNNEKTSRFSLLGTADMLRLINEEDKTVALAVERALPRIAEVIDESYPRLKDGGRMFYVGCGTSGRLGVLDASEIGCTYGTDGKILAIVAGGKNALGDAAAGDEDNFENGRRAVKRYKIVAADVVIGLSASGGTGYVLGALREAHELGALTVGIVNNADSEIAKTAAFCIKLLTGPEVVEGSTRMKAGTAQKMVLNMLSTVLMTKLGKVYRNYMIAMRPYNEKLRRRAVAIVSACAGCEEKEAAETLERADWKIGPAILMSLKKCDLPTAERLLAASGGVLKTE